MISPFAHSVNSHWIRKKLKTCDYAADYNEHKAYRNQCANVANWFPRFLQSSLQWAPLHLIYLIQEYVGIESAIVNNELVLWCLNNTLVHIASIHMDKFRVGTLDITDYVCDHNIQTMLDTTRLFNVNDLYVLRPDEFGKWQAFVNIQNYTKGLCGYFQCYPSSIIRLPVDEGSKSDDDEDDFIAPKLIQRSILFHVLCRESLPKLGETCRVWTSIQGNDREECETPLTACLHEEMRDPWDIEPWSFDYQEFILGYDPKGPIPQGLYIRNPLGGYVIGSINDIQNVHRMIGVYFDQDKKDHRDEWVIESNDGLPRMVVRLYKNDANDANDATSLEWIKEKESLVNVQVDDLLTFSWTGFIETYLKNHQEKKNNQTRMVLQTLGRILDLAPFPTILKIAKDFMKPEHIERFVTMQNQRHFCIQTFLNVLETTLHARFFQSQSRLDRYLLKIN